jgi:hypothetical protein
MRQHRDQPVQTAPGAGDLRSDQRGVGGGMHERWKTGAVGHVRNIFLHVSDVSDNFALVIRGLDDYTKFGASLIVMSIVGGAIATPFMWNIADTHSMRVGFVVPLVCFVFIVIYGALW